MPKTSINEYPDIWLHEMRGGYGYIEHVPCLVIGETPQRIKIIALKANGDTAIRYVRREHIKRGQ